MIFRVIAIIQSYMSTHVHCNKPNKNLWGPQPVATCSCEELHDHQSDESRPEIQPLQRGGHDGHDPSAKSEALCARQSGAWWSAWTSQGCWLMLADCSTENPVRKFSLPGVRTSVWASDLSPVGVLYTKMLSCLLGIPHTLWISVKRLIKSNSC